jgi:hypothetical protein
MDLENVEKIAVDIKNVKQESEKKDIGDKNSNKTDKKDEINYEADGFPKVINSSYNIINDKIGHISRLSNALLSKDIGDRILKTFIIRKVLLLLQYLDATKKEFEYLTSNYRKYYKINNLLHKLMSELVIKHDVIIY